MDLYFLRHGKAESLSSSGRDEDRELTPAGRKQIAALGQTLIDLPVHFDAILSSPYRRAKETAEIIAERLDQKEDVTLLNELACGANLSMLKTKLRDYPSAETLLLVGHLPNLTEIVSEWSQNIPPKPFKPGSLCRLNLKTLEDTQASITLFLAADSHL